MDNFPITLVIDWSGTSRVFPIDDAMSLIHKGISTIAPVSRLKISANQSRLNENHSQPEAG